MTVYAKTIKLKEAQYVIGKLTTSFLVWSAWQSTRSLLMIIHAHTVFSLPATVTILITLHSAVSEHSERGVIDQSLPNVLQAQYLAILRCP